MLFYVANIVEINENKKVRNCPVCKAEVGDFESACEYCGTEYNSLKGTCPHCGGSPAGNKEIEDKKALDAQIAEEERKANGEMLKRQVEEWDREHPERYRATPKQASIIKLVALCIVIVLIVVGIYIGIFLK